MALEKYDIGYRVLSSKCFNRILLIAKSEGLVSIWIAFWKSGSSGKPNVYFFALTYNLAVHNYYSTQQRYCLFVAADPEKMRVSSKHTMQKISRFVLSIFCVILWNVAGVLHDQIEEYDTQRVYSICKMHFNTHGPWLSKPDNRLRLSLSC